MISHFSRHILIPGTSQSQSLDFLFTCEPSTCQLVLLVCSRNRKPLVNSKYITPIWSPKINPKLHRIPSQQMNFIQTQPKFPCQITKAILIRRPCTITEPFRAIEAFLKHYPASRGRSLVTKDWKGTFWCYTWRLYNVDSADIKSRVVNFRAVSKNYNSMTIYNQYNISLMSYKQPHPLSIKCVASQV